MPPAMRPMANRGLEVRVDVPGVQPMVEKRLVVLMLPTMVGLGLELVLDVDVDVDVIPRSKSSSSPP